MFRKFNLGFFAIVLTLISCSTDSNDLQTSENTDQSNSMARPNNMTAGEVHNNMLDRFYDSNYNSFNFEDVVNVIDEELIVIKSPVTFSSVLEENNQIQQDLKKLVKYEGDIDQINAFFTQLRDDGISTPEQYYYSKKLMNIHKDYEGNIKSFNSALDNYENEIIADNNLSTSFKENFLDASSISRFSHQFWYENNLNSTSRVSHIAGADTAGALTMIQTGAVTYGSMFGGPWGGFAVLVGGAALSSIMAAN